MKARAIVVAVGLLTLSSGTALGAGTVHVETPGSTAGPTPTPGEPGDEVPMPQSHTARDAECSVVVPLLDSGACFDTWNQSAGTFLADWHSTFHDLWTVGHLTLTVRDDAGRVVFQRDCQWLGATGLCIVQSQDGIAGTWTMRLDARVDATVGASSTAHGWFDLVPA